MSFTLERKLLNNGGSTVLIIPRDWAKERDLKPGPLVQVELEDDCLTVRPAKQQRKGGRQD